MVVIFARSWQQDNEPRSDTRYTTPSGSLSSTIHPWNPHFLLWYTRPDASRPSRRKTEGGERTKTEREREAEDWCLTVILNCKLIHRPFEINLYLGDLHAPPPSKSIDTRFSIYFSLILAHPRFPFSILEYLRDDWWGGEGPRGNKFRRCWGSRTNFVFPRCLLFVYPGIRAWNGV